MRQSSAAPAASAPTDAAGFDAILEQPTTELPRARVLPGASSSSGAPGPASAAVSSSPTLEEFAHNWPLYRDPVLCGILAGVGLSALGVFVVLRRAVFVTAALSQAAGLGVALAFYLSIHHALELPPVVGALLASVAATLLVGLRSSPRIGRETQVAIVFVGASALAVLVGDRFAQEAHDIAAILFGTAVLVRSADLWMVFGSAVLALGTLLVLGRALTFTGFDPDGARVQGLPVRSIEAVFWGVFALHVAVAARALGSLPVFALAVLPAATGLLLAPGLRAVLAVAIGVGAFAGGAGYLLAFLYELPVGTAQALVAAFCVLVAFGVERARRH
ncbi:MAG TPA: metal ABC transporter permease [Polyangiaceae bacterium]|nr:metal ABC transporter permease [Polyangiaceae bacterium]